MVRTAPGLGGEQDPLGGYLDREAGRRRGPIGCAFFAADWIVELGRGDPAAAFRGCSERTCLHRLAEARDLISLVSPGMAAVGLAPAASGARPHAGDVGVVQAFDAEGAPMQAAAIFAGGCWVTITTGGLIAGPFETLALWSLSCPRP